MCWWAHYPHHSIDQLSVFLRLSRSWFWNEEHQFPVCSYVWFGHCCCLKVELSITVSQRSRAGNPSIRNPASREMISDSVELCETAVCFLHIQLTGTNVLVPKMHKTPPEVDFEDSSSPAKSESWSKPNRQCCTVLPT